MEIEATNEIASDIAFEEFKKQLKAYEESLTEVITYDQLKKFIFSDFQVLSRHFIDLGTYTSGSEITKGESVDLVRKYLINYILPETFKDIAILHRDIFLELYKTSIYCSEHQITEEAKHNHFIRSKEVLLAAVADFSTSVYNQETSLTTNSSAIRKVNYTISLQNNPWSIYKSQYESILNQIKEIEKIRSSLAGTIAVFDQLKSKTNRCQSPAQCTDRKNPAKCRSHDRKSFNRDSGFDNLLKYVNEHLTTNYYIDSMHQPFLVEVNHLINQLQKIDVPISSSGWTFGKKRNRF